VARALGRNQPLYKTYKLAETDLVIFATIWGTELAL
jgi:hypothetical protein